MDSAKQEAPFKPLYSFMIRVWGDVSGISPEHLVQDAQGQALYVIKYVGFLHQTRNTNQHFPYQADDGEWYAKLRLDRFVSHPSGGGQ